MRIFVLGSYVNANCLSVNNLPVAGESLSAQALWIEHGGKGLNLAVGIHRLGINVELLLAVGRDNAADGLLEFLKTEGVDTRWVIRTSEQSGFGVGFIASGGENFLAVYPGANALLNASHVAQSAAAIAAADLVCAQFEISEAPILAAFSHARKLGIRTLLNPSPWHLPAEELLALTDILVVNETEAALLLGLSAGGKFSPDYWLSGLPVWTEHCAWQGELLIVTLGRQGCVALKHGKVLYQPAWKIASTDETGAGDAFTAGLAMALVSGDSLPTALKSANACGAWVAAHRGVLQALPTLSEITRFIKTKHIPMV